MVGNLDFHDEVSSCPLHRGNTAHFGVARQFVQKAEGRCALEADEYHRPDDIAVDPGRYRPGSRE